VSITLDKLIELARREAERRGALQDVLSAYVIGSVASGSPLLGGTADIDLVLIHDGHPSRRREIVPLSPEVHLDITHHARAMYRRPRRLRTQPWLGPSICEPLFLYDPDHFFEWAQASARGQFHRADYVQARATAFLARARRHKAALDGSANGWFPCYLGSVLEAANSAASFAGFPAAGRRLSLTLEARLRTVALDDLYAHFNFLLGADQLNHWQTPEMLSAWAQSFDAAAELEARPDLHPVRRNYYLRGFRALMEDGHIEAVIWPLLSTWVRANTALRGCGQPIPKEDVWQATLEQLKLAPSHRSGREKALEQFIDRVEEYLGRWAEGHLA
jgi:predicted nucleotidyltransferase